MRWSTAYVLWVAVQLDRLPRMADFALWATACETALWPAGTFARAYAANRRAAIESIIEADPIATCVRAIMIDRPLGPAARQTFCGCVRRVLAMTSRGAPAWAKNPRALAGRLRRAQTFLRTLGIEITFSREGRTGTRMIRVTTSAERPSVPSASSVSSVPPTEMGLEAHRPYLRPEIRHRLADDTDDADAKHHGWMCTRVNQSPEKVAGGRFPCPSDADASGCGRAVLPASPRELRPPFASAL